MPVDLDAERAWGCATGTLRKETAPINVTVATRPGLGSESTRTVTTCDTASREEMQPPAWGLSDSEAVLMIELPKRHATPFKGARSPVRTHSPQPEVASGPAPAATKQKRWHPQRRPGCRRGCGTASADGLKFTSSTAADPARM
jgi:hypothetical protein